MSCCLAKKKPSVAKGECSSNPLFSSMSQRLGKCRSPTVVHSKRKEYTSSSSSSSSSSFLLPPFAFFATETKTEREERSLSMTVLPQWINARQQKSAKDSFVKGKRKWCTTVQGLSRSTPFRRLPKAVSLFCRLSLSAPLLFVRRDGEEEGEWQLATRVDGSRKESFVAEGLQYYPAWDDDPKRKDFPRLLPASLRYIHGLDRNST